MKFLKVLFSVYLMLAVLHVAISVATEKPAPTPLAIANYLVEEFHRNTNVYGIDDVAVLVLADNASEAAATAKQMVSERKNYGNCTNTKLDYGTTYPDSILRMYYISEFVKDTVTEQGWNKVHSTVYESFEFDQNKISSYGTGAVNVYLSTE